MQCWTIHNYLTRNISYYRKETVVQIERNPNAVEIEETISADARRDAKPTGDGQCTRTAADTESKRSVCISPEDHTHAPFWQTIENPNVKVGHAVHWFPVPSAAQSQHGRSAHGRTHGLRFSALHRWVCYHFIYYLP